MTATGVADCYRYDHLGIPGHLSTALFGLAHSATPAALSACALTACAAPSVCMVLLF
jgi:hypothetical protein